MEQVIARIATGGKGIVTYAELRAAGVSPEEIKQRVRRGTLIREYRGVYRVGHRAPSVEARYMAAVKACGPEGALSGRAAAHWLGLIKGSAPAPEVTAPTCRRVRGIRTRRRRVPTMRWRGIPATTVAQTLIDLAATLPLTALVRACHEAEVIHNTMPDEVLAIMRPNAPGAGKLERALLGDEHVTLSKLERRFLGLLREQGLPLPETNKPKGSYRVDCRWPEQKLSVELDSYRFHKSRHAWEQDRKREREAYARGDDLRRYTWGDVFEDQRLMLAELAKLLATAPSARR